ncbi:hypothetical protein A2U01_0043042, partial [Trifolium medium]|nr:hypothetical protein [Trifolium medium]
MNLGMSQTAANEATTAIAIRDAVVVITQSAIL